MLNYNFIDHKAKESKIDTITILKEYWQLLFLQKMYSLENSEKIFFKGGTAIRFLLGSFRFSEDLDFTSVAKKEIAERLLFDTFNYFVKNIDSNLEFKKERVISKFKEESLRYRFLILPKSSNQKVSIRIDVSLRENPQTKKQKVLIPFDYPISPYPLVVHLSMEEILAEKIRALFTRGKSRDLFDLWFLLTKKITLDQKLIEKKFKIYPRLKFSLEKLKKIILSYEEKKLKKEINQFLPENYRNFYRDLKEQTLNLLPSS